MNICKLLALLLALAAAATFVGHAVAHQAPASLQQQQHSRKVLQPAGTSQQYAAVSSDELLEQALVDMLATATQRQPKPPPAAASDAAAAAAATSTPQVLRCGTKEGSRNDRAAAEQRFKARLQQLGFGDEVLTAGVRTAQSNGTGVNTTSTDVAVSGRIMKGFHHA
jgi:hypothetical protein